MDATYWRRWRLLFSGVLLCLVTLLPSTASATSLLFVTSSPITPGKFKALSDAAAPHGVKVEAQFIEKMGVVDARLWVGHDMVLFDAPRDHIQEAIAAKVNDALPALAQAKTPVCLLYTSPSPRD